MFRMLFLLWIAFALANEVPILKTPVPSSQEGTTTQPSTHVYNWTVIWTVSKPDGFAREVIGVYNTSDLQNCLKNVTDNSSDYSYDIDAVVLPGFPFPGPEVRVRQGDVVEINVVNSIDSLISLHLHGIHMKHNAWMDGTHGVTQCGIPPGESYKYRFTVDQPPGTHWYHSHSGAQFGDGFQGAFVIMAPEPTLDARDDVVFLQDWAHESYHTLSAKYTSRVGSFVGFLADYPFQAINVLINGKGQFDCKWISEEDCLAVRKWGWPYVLNNYNDSYKFPPRPKPYQTNGQCNPSRPPYMGLCNASDEELFSVLQCVPGRSIRLRLIGSSFGVGVRFWIDRHNMTIIAKDGQDVIEDGPHAAVLVYLGQRIDVRVQCTGDASKSYYVFAALAYEFYPGGQLKSPNVSSYAVLNYGEETKAIQIPKHPPYDWPNKDLMPGYSKLDDYLPMHEYSLRNVVVQPTPPATERFVFDAASRGHWWNYEEDIEGRRFEWWEMNGHVPYHPPREPVLHLYQRGRTLSDDQGYGPRFGSLNAPLVQKLQYRASDPLTYEFVIVNNEGQPHPWHVHGYSLDLLGYGWLDANYTYRLPNNVTPSTYRNGSFFYDPKEHGLPELWESTTVVSRGDSFTVPLYGFAVFRLTADNPGPWLVHCLMEYHLEVGMAFLLSVENDGSYNLPLPQGTPACSCSLDETSNPTPPPSHFWTIVGVGAVCLGVGLVLGWILSKAPKKRSLRTGSESARLMFSRG